MLAYDIDQAIREYYVWAAQQDPADIGFPHQTPFRRLLGGSVGSLSLSDDDAMEINRSLCMLWRDDPDCYEVIRLYYQDRRSFRWMEKRGIGERRALARRMADGIQFVRGVLYAAA